MKQGTIEWLNWRKKHVGASDQTHLHMSAPWSVGWAGLYDIKTGAAEEAPANEYMNRGIELENAARLEYSLQSGIDVEPALIENVEFPYLAASLDGYNAEMGHVVEIKCPGKEGHAIAKRGEIPHKYIPQLCHQLFVTGAKSLDYFSYDGESGVIVPFRPTKELVLEVVQAAKDFWNLHVLPGVRPTKEYPLPQFDTRIPEVTDQELLLEAKWNLELRGRKDELEAQLAASDEKILSNCKLNKARIGGLQIVTTQRAGTIDYSKVPQLSGIDLGAYRKEGKATRSLRRT